MGQSVTRSVLLPPHCCFVNSMKLNWVCGKLVELSRFTTEKDKNVLWRADSASNVLEYMPSDMIIHILQYSALGDLVALSCTSQNFRNYWTLREELLSIHSCKYPYYRFFITPTTTSPLLKLFFCNHFQTRLQHKYEHFRNSNSGQVVILRGEEHNGRTTFVNSILTLPQQRASSLVLPFANGQSYLLGNNSFQFMWYKGSQMMTNLVTNPSSFSI